jgi:arylsulfatase A-like enzyme
LLNKPQTQQKHEFLYFEYPENGGWISIRLGNWKAVRKQVKKNPNAPWELYDLSIDPKELNNVAHQHTDIIKQMDTIVLKEHQRSHLVDWEFLY